MRLNYRGVCSVMEMGIDRILFSVDAVRRKPARHRMAEDAAARPRRHREAAERQRPPPAQALNGADAHTNVFAAMPSPIIGPLSSVNGDARSCPLRDLADGLGIAATAENRFRPTTGYAAARFANSVTAEGTEARAVSIAAARCSGPRARPSALLAADGRPLINLVGAIRGSRERGARSTPPRGRIHRRTRCRRRVPATGAPFRRSCEHPPRREYASDRP